MNKTGIKIAITLGLICLITQQVYLIHFSYSHDLQSKSGIGVVISGLITLYLFLIYKLWVVPNKKS